MNCPTCSIVLDDILEFDRLGPLRCPKCGRGFTDRELAQPTGENKNSYRRVERPRATYKSFISPTSRKALPRGVTPVWV